MFWGSMDNQFLNLIAFAGFSGFVGGVVITWTIARMVFPSRSDSIRDQVGSHGVAQLKRLAEQQSRQTSALSDANKLAQSASADMAKAAELLKQAEGAMRANAEQLNSLATGPSFGPTNLESEPLRPRAARA